MIPVYLITSKADYDTTKEYFLGESTLLYFRHMLEYASEYNAYIVASDNCTFSGRGMVDSMEMLELCQKNATIRFTTIDNEDGMEIAESIVERIEVK